MHYLTLITSDIPTLEEDLQVNAAVKKGIYHTKPVNYEH